VENKCNLVTNKCLGSRKLELEALKCIVKQMDLYTEFYFKESYELPGRKTDSEFFEELVQKLTKDEVITFSTPPSLFLCLLLSLLSFFFVNPDLIHNQCRNDQGHITSLRDVKEFKAIDQSCVKARGCETDYCLDTSCEISPSACLSTCQMNWINVQYEKLECESKKKVRAFWFPAIFSPSSLQLISFPKCNWIPDDCDALDGTPFHQDANSNCKKQCGVDKEESYCGYCSDEATCVEIPGIDSKVSSS
jgi:hypothetical protein